MKNTGNFKVFITDDDTFCLTMYEQLLSELQFLNIQLFTNGADCLINLNANPDIIFLDQNMKNMSGLEVLKKIKELSPETYVVLVTSQESIALADSTLTSGAYDYVIKDSNVGHRLKNIVTKIYLLKDEKNRRDSTGSIKNRFF